jgi:hypothetical protein
MTTKHIVPTLVLIVAALFAPVGCSSSTFGGSVECSNDTDCVGELSCDPPASPVCSAVPPAQGFCSCR